MIRLKDILLEQSQEQDTNKEKLNVLFVTDYPTNTVGNFAKRLISSGKVTGDIKSYSNESSLEAVSIVAYNISNNYNLLVVQISGYRDKSGKELLNNLNRIQTIADKKNVPVVFIATPDAQFISNKKIKFITQVYNMLGNKDTVIDLSDINDDSYFTDNKFTFSNSGNQIIYSKVLEYLKRVDNSIEITPEDSQEIDDDSQKQANPLKKAVDKVKNAVIPAGAMPDVPMLSKATPGTWQYVMQYLIGKGLSKAGAAGIAGNMRIESNFNPGVHGDKGTSYGICQWHASRKTALFNFAKSEGRPVNDIDLQLDYLWKELTTSYSGLLSTLKTTTDARSAAYEFAAKFEIPLRISNKRLDYAQQYFESYESETGISAGDIALGVISTAAAMFNKDVKTDSKNGQMSSSELKSIGGRHRLRPDAADAFLRMKAAYEAENTDPKTGKPTRTIKVSDSYRPREVQNSIFDWDLFKRTGKRAKKGTNGTVAAAYPGTSNHGRGIALDLGPDHAQAWIRKNGMKYGWSWDEGRSVGEPWHFTYVK